MAKMQEAAPNGKCPVCGKPLASEFVPIGYDKMDEEGNQKKKLRVGTILPIAIGYAIESWLYKYIASKRPEYVVCHNEECPLCYRAIKPLLLKKTVVGPPTLRGDSTGMIMQMLAGGYRKKKKKKK